MSGSRLRTASSSLDSLYRHLRDGIDRIEVSSFTEEVELLLPLHTKQAGGNLADARRRLTANGGTFLWSTIVYGLSRAQASAEVDIAAGRVARNTRVVIVTDGLDDGSGLVKLEDAIAALEARAGVANARLYIIAIEVTPDEIVTLCTGRGYAKIVRCRSSEMIRRAFRRVFDLGGAITPPPEEDDGPVLTASGGASPTGSWAGSRGYNSGSNSPGGGGNGGATPPPFPRRARRMSSGGGVTFGGAATPEILTAVAASLADLTSGGAPESDAHGEPVGTCSNAACRRRLLEAQVNCPACGTTRTGSGLV